MKLNSEIISSFEKHAQNDIILTFPGDIPRDPTSNFTKTFQSCVARRKSIKLLNELCGDCLFISARWIHLISARGMPPSLGSFNSMVAHLNP